MFCPRCGVTQAENRERCSRCTGLLARPEVRPLSPVREVASPTRRGELAQRAAGLVIPPRPQRRPEPVPPAPPALGGPVASPRPPASYPAPVVPAATASQAAPFGHGPPTGSPTAAYPPPPGYGPVPDQRRPAPGTEAAPSGGQGGEPRPGDPGWPPPPGPWQGSAAGAGQTPADRRPSSWTPRPNGTE